MSTVVYTATPLLTKLGFLEGMRVLAINPPDDYFEILGELPLGLEVYKKTESRVECVHIFVDEDNHDINSLLKDASGRIYSMGMIWVSWPRKTTNPRLNEAVIKRAALGVGLKDEKFTLLNDYWCGLLLRPARRR